MFKLKLILVLNSNQKFLKLNEMADQYTIYVPLRDAILQCNTTVTVKRVVSRMYLLQVKALLFRTAYLGI